MISSFHLLPIIWTVVATGQAGISSKEEYTMPFFTKITSTQLDRLRQVLAEVDALVIGAGAGLSASAGLTYDGPRPCRCMRPCCPWWRGETTLC